MAVTVIDEKPDPRMAKKITCRSCGVGLEYFPIDVKKYEGRDYSGGPDGREWIVCPRCGQDVTIRSW